MKKFYFTSLITIIVFILTLTTTNSFAQNAGADGETCDGTYTMQADASSGYWSVISGNGIFANTADPNTNVTNIALGNNIFRWTLNAGGAFDDVTITNNQVTANAGADQNISTDNTTLAANDPSAFGGTGFWTIAGSGTAIITNSEQYNTSVSNLQIGLNKFIWETGKGNCQNKDSVNILYGTSQTDSLALVALYNSTDGPNWTNKTNWLTGNLDTWFGVTLDGNGRVTSLDLSSDNLVGTIPHEIGNLTNLSDLYLEGNQLSGSIPVEIGNLTNLSEIYLEGNQLSGSIPHEIGNLTNLTYLGLHQNQLSGSIPHEIGNLTNLPNLDLSYNQLSGSIPVEIENLTNLTSLNLGLNQLSGSIPVEIGNLTNLTYFRLEDNNFDSLPDLSALINLGYAYIYENNLTFSDLTTANINATTYTYQPQKNVTLNQTQFYVEEASNFTLDIATLSDGQISDPGNVYQWYYNSNPISGATATIYTINNFSQTEDGIYYCEITNTNFPDLTLKSQDITLINTNLETGLVADYPFNGNANDESGNGNNGTDVGGVSYVEDRFGNSNSACYFDGADGLIEIPNNVDLNLPNIFTLTGWFNSSNVNTEQFIISKTDLGQLKRSYHFSWNGTTMSWEIAVSSSGDTPTCYYEFTDNIEPNTWYFFSVLYNDINENGEKIQLYINSQKKDVSIINYENNGIPLANDVSLHFGAVRNNGVYERFFNGNLDDIRIYNRALSEKEVNELYARYESYSLGNVSISYEAPNFDIPLNLSDTIYNAKGLEFALPFNSDKYTFNNITLNSTDFPNFSLTNFDVTTNVQNDSLYVSVLSKGTERLTAKGKLLTANFTKAAELVNSTDTFTTSQITEIYDTENIMAMPASGVVKTYFYSNINIDDAVAYYPFNGNAKDETLNGHDGIVNGAILANDRFGNPNSAYIFDGLDDYINIGNATDLKRFNSDFSISVWLKHYEENSSGTILSNRTSGTHAPGSKIGIDINNYIGFTVDGGIYATGITCETQMQYYKWEHKVVTFKYTGTNDNIVTFYSNGVYDKSGTIKDILDPGSTDTYIGYESGGQPIDYHYTGLMDEIRIYNRVLSPNEISFLAETSYAKTYSLTDTTYLTTAANFNLPITVSDTLKFVKGISYEIDYDQTKVMYNNQLTINNDIIAPGEVVYDVTDDGDKLTVNATAQTGYFFEGAGNVFNLQFKQLAQTADTAIFRLSQVTEQYNSDPIICSGDSCQIIFNDLGDGLVAHYPFNGNANDESGNGNDGTVYGTTSLTVDRFGNQNSAYSFMGDSIVVLDSDILDLSDEYTLIVWTKTPMGAPFGNGEDDTNYPLISKWGDNGMDAYGISTNANRTLSTYTYNGSSYSMLEDTTLLDFDTWYQIAVTRSTDDSLKLYLNGVLVENMENSVVPQASNSNLNFGAIKQLGSLIQEYDGTLDDISIYNRTLSQTEIMNLYNKVGSVYAGEDQQVCDTTAQLSAEDPSPYTGRWFTTGTGTGVFTDATNNITQVTALSQGINEFEWTVNVNGNIYRDTVAIINNAVTTFAGNDTVVYWTEHPIPSSEMQMNAMPVTYPAVGLWSTNSPNAYFADNTLANTMVYDLRAGLNRLTWTVSNQNCVTSDDVLVFSSNNIHNNGNGPWNSPTTWIPEVVPTQWDSVTITNGIVDLTGYEGNCRRLRVKDNGTLIVQEDALYSPGNLHCGEIWVEQEVEKNKGNASLYIKQGGSIWIEQEVEKAIQGRGLIVGSGGMVSIEQEVEKNGKGNPARLFIEAGKSLYVSATQPYWASPEASLYLGRNGYIWIEQEVEKNKQTKGLARTHGLYIGSGGMVSIEQEVEKGKAFSGLTVRNGGMVSIEQEVEKSKALSPGSLYLHGGMVSIEQEVEKGNNTLGALLVKHGGLLQIEPNTLGADAVINVPRLKIQGGTVINGTDAKAGRSSIYSGMVSIEQEVEKGKELTNPNLTVKGNGELNFLNMPFEEKQNAYMDIADGGSFTMMPGSSIITENSIFATISMEDGASFVDETEGSGVPGEVIVEQNLIPGAKLVATPVNGFQNSEFEYSDIFQWNESTVNWDEITQIEPLKVAQGYKLITSTLDTIAYIGDFSYGAQSFELTGDLTNHNLTTRGWNLAGNPYTSAIDWEQLSLSGIENTVYTYNEITQNFEVYQQGGITLNNADNMISTASGMFIKTHPNTASATLNFGAKSRVHEIPGLYPKYDSKELPESIQLSVSGNAKTDQIILRFEDSALPTFESNKDAFKLFSLSPETPQLYTKTTDNNFLCIDVRDFPIFGTASIVPLNFHSGISGTYTINADNINLNSNYSVILKDLDNNTETDLSTTPTYAFNYTTGVTDEGFELIFNKTVGVDNLNPEAGNVQIYSSGKYVYVRLKDIKGNAQISIYSVTGQKLIGAQVISSINKYYIPHAEGIYFVKVVTEKGVVTRSVFLYE